MCIDLLLSSQITTLSCNMVSFNACVFLLYGFLDGRGGDPDEPKLVACVVWYLAPDGL